MEYRDLLGEVHAALQPDVYLEIGVRNGASLALSLGKTIGVDPAMAESIRVSTLRPWTKLYRETSDAFFAAREAGATLEGGRLELAFIDGLHLFEQVLRDLINVEAWAAPGALILIHDVLPPSVRSTSREPLSGAWVGDVWKIVPVLRTYRPDLALTLVAAPPSGLLALRRPEQVDPALATHYDAIVAEALREDPDPAGAVTRHLAEEAAESLTPEAFLAGLTRPPDETPPHQPDAGQQQAGAGPAGIGNGDGTAQGDSALTGAGETGHHCGA